jgi:hypothetical protein
MSAQMQMHAQAQRGFLVVVRGVAPAARSTRLDTLLRVEQLRTELGFPMLCGAYVSHVRLFVIVCVFRASLPPYSLLAHFGRSLRKGSYA